LKLTSNDIDDEIVPEMYIYIFKYH